MARIAMKPTGREGGTRTCPQGSTGTTATLRIILPRHLTTGMTRWRFQGTQFYSPTKSLLTDQVKSTKSNPTVDQVQSFRFRQSTISLAAAAGWLPVEAEPARAARTPRWWVRWPPLAPSAAGPPG